MGRAHKPKCGSRQFQPRCRARRPFPRVRSWLGKSDLKLLGFAGYKAGMTHVMAVDATPNSPTKNMTISIPATIIECPPIKVFSIRFYKKTAYGSSLITEHLDSKLDKELERTLRLPKKFNNKKVDSYDYLTLLVHTQPKLTGIGKKRPEMFEIAVGGNDQAKILEYANSLLGKEIKLSDVFKESSYVDIHGVTKGKGFQGPVKRYGISLKSHKSEKKRRAPANLGAWTPKKVNPTVPQHGQLGFFSRVEYNKLILSINPDFVKKQNLSHYGDVKNDFLLIKGSIPGANRRLVRIVDGIRVNKKPKQLQFIK
ncbi:MAG: 50S ribosomal protein L3 [Candidatus Nanoarchaeia archaeon]|nr:50S ribosomal protein L3 [Candidatus Nanoarchaeia archaeon]